MTQIVAEQLEERLGHRFKRPELLERALTHSSAIPELRAEQKVELQEPTASRDNERGCGQGWPFSISWSKCRCRPVAACRMSCWPGAVVSAQSGTSGNQME